MEKERAAEKHSHHTLEIKANAYDALEIEYKKRNDKAVAFTEDAIRLLEENKPMPSTHWVFNAIRDILLGK